MLSVSVDGQQWRVGTLQHHNKQTEGKERVSMSTLSEQFDAGTPSIERFVELDRQHTQDETAARECSFTLPISIGHVAQASHHVSIGTRSLYTARSLDACPKRLKRHIASARQH